jgi:hypothetical protein
MRLTDAIDRRACYRLKAASARLRLPICWTRLPVHSPSMLAATFVRLTQKAHPERNTLAAVR